MLFTSRGAFLTCPLEGSGTSIQHRQMKKRKYNMRACVFDFLILYTDMILTSTFHKSTNIKIQEQELYHELQCGTESPRSETSVHLETCPWFMEGLDELTHTVT